MPESKHKAFCIFDKESVAVYQCPTCGRILIYCSEADEVVLAQPGNFDITHEYVGGLINGSISMGCVEESASVIPKVLFRSLGDYGKYQSNIG